MKTISTKVELIEWLKEQHIYSDIWCDEDIPDVKPARNSKWKDSEFDPEWLSDGAVVKVPRGHMKDEIGGYVKVIIDLTEQNDTVRVKFVRGFVGKNFYTAITRFGTIDFPKAEVYKCQSHEELIDLINPKFRYKLLLEKE
ncbi:hypothetical protein [Alteromonas sp. BMJM2]|uniref:hypothetical protein n=1 Tax=Alteromonas sp. BMJM2 TaxID=2954241 RepID=UPI0022B2BAF4|nr:hypothetical protein [Alteromonas sp. BMJM2]